MLRIVIFLVLVFLALFGLNQLAGIEGRMEMRVGEWLIDWRSGLVLGALGFAVLSAAVIGAIVSGAISLPNTIRRKREESRRSRGMVALSRGLEAVLVGDADDAQRHARVAQKQLNEPNLTRLLTAQAAQLAGDDETAQSSYAAMLDAPETEFLGLRGLYQQAMSAGDRKEARGYASRAFKLRPGAEWAYRSVYQLNVDQGFWGEALDSISLAQQHGLESGDAGKRKQAALLTANAYDAENAGDTETALRDAEAALKHAPGFAPAAVLAARLEAAAGRRSKAGKLLDEAWAIAPHPALPKTLSDLYADEKLERRTARLKKMADKAPGTDESLLVIAEQDIALGEFEAARVALEPLFTRAPRARAFSAMGRAMEGLFGREAAQVWYDRAAAAPLDPVPGADGVFHFTRDGWQRLIREFGDHGRLAPPPLEELQTGLSLDEVKLLTAAPTASLVDGDATDGGPDDGAGDAANSLEPSADIPASADPSPDDSGPDGTSPSDTDDPSQKKQ